MVLGSADHSLPRAGRPGDARGGRAVVPRLRTADGRTDLRDRGRRAACREPRAAQDRPRPPQSGSRDRDRRAVVLVARVRHRGDARRPAVRLRRAGPQQDLARRARVQYEGPPDLRAPRVPAGGRAPRGHLQGRTFRERHADEHPGARTSGRTGRLTHQSSNRSRGAVLMYRGPPFVMRTSSSIRTPPNPGTYTPGSSVKTMFGRSTRSLDAFSAPPSWTARPIECPSPWMNRPLYLVRSIRSLAAASTDFAFEPGLIRASAAAWARATMPCIRRCSSDARFLSRSNAAWVSSEALIPTFRWSLSAAFMRRVDSSRVWNTWSGRALFFAASSSSADVVISQPPSGMSQAPQPSNSPSVKPVA